MPASASASCGASQYTPVPSIAAADTPCPRSQPASSRRPDGSASKRRVSAAGGPPAPLSLTVAVISILCTSRPAARAWTTCSSSFTIANASCPKRGCEGGRTGRRWKTRACGAVAVCCSSTARGRAHSGARGRPVGSVSTRGHQVPPLKVTTSAPRLRRHSPRPRSPFHAPRGGRSPTMTVSTSAGRRVATEPTERSSSPCTIGPARDASELGDVLLRTDPGRRE